MGISWGNDRDIFMENPMGFYHHPITMRNSRSCGCYPPVAS